MGISAAIGGALIAGSSVYTARKQKKAMKKAEEARSREADRLFNLQEEEMRKQEERLAEQQEAQKEAQAETEKTQKRETAAARKRKKERGAGGRSSTILTGAQGIEDQAAQKGRTLLGV